MKKIKIGQIGICHEHAAGKIKTLRNMSDIYQIIGVVDDRDTTAARFAGDNLKPYEGLTWMTEDELLNYPGLQAVLVETPNNDLVPTAIRCMEHNLAIHMDKPAGEDLRLFKKLLEGCKERNLPFQMGYVFRNNLAIQFCLKAVRKNWLGNIFEVEATMSHDYGGKDYQDYLGNFKGGIMFNLGCHLIDFIITMFGKPQKITPFLKSMYACDLEVNGIARRRLKICGTKGTIELSPLERFDGKPLQLLLTLREGNEEYSAGTHIVNCGVKYDRYQDQLLELAKIINGEMENPYTYEHEYLVHEVVLAASGYIKWECQYKSNDG